MNTTGLSYFFTKLSGIFSRIGHKHGKADITDLADWAKADSKPSYAYSEISGKPTTFTPSIHTHSAERCGSILPIKRGGTGAATAPKTTSSTGITVGALANRLQREPLALSTSSSGGGRWFTAAQRQSAPSRHTADRLPSGWLMCDGSEVSREEYSLLFDAIGTAYGDGDEARHSTSRAWREGQPSDRLLHMPSVLLAARNLMR